MNNVKKIFVEFADTDIKRQYGLMNRKTLGSNSGMLFKFPSEMKLSFWMRDTYIPLDIAFIDDAGKILQVEEMIPLSTKSIKSNEICRYALEVNKGWFKNNNIKVGDIVAGEYINTLKKTNAQSNVGMESQQNQQIQQNPISPNVQINKSFKDIIKEANINDKKLNIIYQSKNGFVLPPKTISPPFELIKDENGHPNSIVRAWDEQTAGWKSFIIDNIISLEYLEEK